MRLTDEERKARARERLKAWRLANPEKVKAQQDRHNKGSGAEWRKQNRERHNASVRTYRARNRETAAAWHRAQTDRHPERYMLKAARYRALKAGVDFDIEEQDIVIPATCPVLGLKLSRSIGCGGGRMSDRSPSLDRIDPSIGYVKGNIAVVSNRANRLKNDGNADEHERIAAWIRKFGAP